MDNVWFEIVSFSDELNYIVLHDSDPTSENGIIISCSENPAALCWSILLKAFYWFK